MRDIRHPPVERARRRPGIAGLLILSLLGGCVSLPPGVDREFACGRNLPNHYGGPSACGTWQVDKPGTGEDFQGLPVRDGLVVLIELPEPASLFLSLAAQRLEPFVHAGLIALEPGGPVVYESFGVFSPWGSGPPTTRMGGGVRRVTLRSFLQRPGIIAAYSPPPGTDAQAVVRYARAQYSARTPFDGRFDADDAGALYCVEFVARALEAGGAQPLPRVPLTRNASMRVVLDWLQVNPDGLLLAGDLASPARRVWLLSRYYRPAQIDRYFALQSELHARFTPEQKLGALFQWRGFGLRWRPRVRDYLETGMRSTVEDPVLLAQRLFEGRDVLSAIQPDPEPARTVPAGGS